MDITTYEISTFEFDFLKKRMIVGDTKGNITLHNTANGAKMKTLSKHNGEITHLIATQNDSNVDIFISCALDNEIRIFK
jgi:WD40 repeat protein